MSHRPNAFLCVSKKYPVIKGAKIELIAKHWEKRAKAIPLYSYGAVFIIASVAVGKNEANEKAISTWAKRIRTKPAW